MQKYKSINRIAFFNIASTILLHGVTFFTTPYISAALGTANYGMFSIYSTWTEVVKIIFGLSTVSSIAVARKKFTMEEQIKYQSSALFLSTFSFLIFSVITTIAIVPISRILRMSNSLVAVMLMHAFGLMALSHLNIKFTYEFKADRNLILSLFSTVSNVILTLILINCIETKDNYWAGVMGYAVPSFAIGVFACIYIYSNGKTFYDKKYWSFCLPICLPFIFHLLSSTVLHQCDKVMIRNLLGNSAVGIYSLAAGFASILFIIYTALNNSWAPFFYEYARNDDRQQMVDHGRRYIELFTVLSIGFVLLTPEVFKLYAPIEYQSGSSFICLFTMGYYFVFLYSLSVNYEIYFEKTKVVAIATFLAAGFNVILNLLLIPQLKVLGAVIATVLSHGLQYVFHYIAAKYFIVHNKYPFDVAFIFPYFSAMVITTLLCYIIKDGYPIFRWGCGIGLGILELTRVLKRKSLL